MVQPAASGPVVQRHRGMALRLPTTQVRSPPAVTLTPLAGSCRRSPVSSRTRTPPDGVAAELASGLARFGLDVDQARFVGGHVLLATRSRRRWRSARRSASPGWSGCWCRHRRSRRYRLGSEAVPQPGRLSPGDGATAADQAGHRDGGDTDQRQAGGDGCAQKPPAAVAPRYPVVVQVKQGQSMFMKL